MKFHLRNLFTSEVLPNQMFQILYRKIIGAKNSFLRKLFRANDNFPKIIIYLVVTH